MGVQAPSGKSKVALICAVANGGFHRLHGTMFLHKFPHISESSAFLSHLCIPLKGSQRWRTHFSPRTAPGSIVPISFCPLVVMGCPKNIWAQWLSLFSTPNQKPYRALGVSMVPPISEGSPQHPERSQGACTLLRVMFSQSTATLGSEHDTLVTAALGPCRCHHEVSWYGSQ